MSFKKCAVRYFTRTSNTEKLARAVAEGAHVHAESIVTPIESKTDILFLGCSVYWAGIDPHIRDYIETLDPESVGTVAIFSTSALVERARPEVEKLLARRGIKVVDEDFYCRGQFQLLHHGKPDAEYLEQARAWAASIACERA